MATFATHEKRLAKLTEREHQMLELLNSIAFYADTHSERCAWRWYHGDPKHPCNCKQGQIFLKVNKLLTYYGMGYYEPKGVRGKG